MVTSCITLCEEENFIPQWHTFYFYIVTDYFVTLMLCNIFSTYTFNIMNSINLHLKKKLNHDYYI